MSEVNQTPQVQEDRVDSNGLLYIFRLLRDVFVGKESGKGLSTEDYTTAEKTKLAGIETGAQVNPTIDSALSNSSTNPIQNKAVKDALDLKAPLASPAFTGNPTVPTQTTTDDSTKAASTAFVKAAISAALSGKIDLNFDFSYNSKASLPATGVIGTFYFIPATNSETGTDEFEEYVWDSTNSKYERVGAAKVDLSNYFNTTNLPAITNAQIDTLLASSATPAQSGS